MLKSLYYNPRQTENGEHIGMHLSALFVCVTFSVQLPPSPPYLSAPTIAPTMKWCKRHKIDKHTSKGRKKRSPMHFSISRNGIVALLNLESVYLSLRNKKGRRKRKAHKSSKKGVCECVSVCRREIEKLFVKIEPCFVGGKCEKGSKRKDTKNPF